MKSVCALLATALVAVLSVTAFAQPSGDPLFGRETAGRPIEGEIGRPNDASATYLTVFGEVGFDVNKLKSAFPQAHFRQIRSNDPILPSYLPHIGQVPAVAHTYADGKTIYKVSGRNVPTSNAQLPQLIENLGRPCPCNPPAQPAAPPVAPPIYVPAVPDTVPDEPLTDPSAPLGVYLGLLAASTAAGAGYRWFKEITAGA